MARNAPPRTAINVARRCPAIAPLATPHGDCIEGNGKGNGNGNRKKTKRKKKDGSLQSGE